MAYPITLNGRTYTLADFEGQNYVDGLPDAFEDFVTHAGGLYSTTSTTSNSIGTGSKTFTVESSKPYQVGTPLRITDSAAPSTNWIDAIVTAYSGTTLTVDAVSYAGSGTKTSWNINIGGGAVSYTGTLPVAQGGTGATTEAAARTNLDVYSKGEADTRFLNISGDTGDVSFAGDLTVTGTGAGTRIMVRSDNEGASDGPIVDLYRNSASPAAADDVGIIYFSGENSADEKVQYADLHTFIQNATDGAEGGRLDIRYMAGGSAKIGVQLRSDTGGTDGEVIINQNGADMDFRVESSGLTHLISTSGSGDFVNFGVNATNYDYGGLVNIVTADNSTQLALVSTDGDNSAGPIMLMQRNSPSPADGDLLGSLRFQGKDSADVITTFARIDTLAKNVTDGSQNGEIQIEAVLNGVNTSRMVSNDTGTYFNTNGAALDFRVSTDTIPHFMFIDSSENAMLLTNNTTVTEPIANAVLHISNSNNNPALILESRDGDNQEGPVLQLLRSSGSPVNNDVIGIIRFNGLNDAAEEVTYGFLRAQVRDVTDGSEDAKVSMVAIRQGVDYNFLEYDASGNEVVINESQEDVDFRVEGAGEEYLIMTRASNDCVIMGSNSTITGNPRLSVHQGSSGLAAEMYRASNTGTGTILNMYSDVGGTENLVFHFEANGDLEIDGTLTQSSDQRIKQDIVDSGSQWDDIKAIQVRKYRKIWDVEQYGDDADVHLGVVAQELESSNMGGLVKTRLIDEDDPDSGDIKSVKYSILYMKAIKALQEAMDRIETLETKVAALEAN